MKVTLLQISSNSSSALGQSFW